MTSSITAEIEKIQTVSNPFRQARRIITLQKKHDVRTIEIAEKMGLSSSYICALKRLAKLPEIVVDGFYTKTVSLGHLFVISRLKETNEMIRIYEKVLMKGFTVLRTEEEVRKKLYKVKTEGDEADEKTIEKIRAKLYKIDDESDIQITQTQVRAQVVLTIKGNRKKTTAILKKIADL